MITPIEGKANLVQKRDGRLEAYCPDKMYAVILWACNGSEAFAKELLQAIDIKIHNKIKIEVLYDEVIDTASNMISDLYPQWEEIAKNLYLLKIRKSLGVKRSVYPDYQTVVNNCILAGLYDSALCSTLDIQTLSDAILPEYDNKFTFGGLFLFVDKYCNKHCIEAD